jgi:hypothetical protein
LPIGERVNIGQCARSDSLCLQAKVFGGHPLAGCLGVDFETASRRQRSKGRQRSEYDLLHQLTPLEMRTSDCLREYYGDICKSTVFPLSMARRQIRVSDLETHLALQTESH